MNVAEIITHLEEIAPPHMAAPDDSIGLQVGDASAEVKRIAVAVDPVMSVIDRAVGMGAELLVTHHPLIHGPIEAVVAGVPVADCVAGLIRSGTSLYVMHTNYDAVEGGTNEVLAERLGIRVTGILATWSSERKLKVVVFVPHGAIHVVRDAMADAGAGVIGSYTRCSFRTPGLGTYMPGLGAQPYQGEIGRLEESEELRLEMTVPEWRLGPVVDAMIAAHPYEEVAYDVYRLENQPTAYGPGRIGVLDKPMKLGDLKKRVGDALGYEPVRSIGDAGRVVNKVAFCSGGGKSLLSDAIRSGADLYITGDIGYHDMLNADAAGLAIIDVGHYHSECPGMEALAERLAKDYAAVGVTVEFLSQAATL